MIAELSNVVSIAQPNSPKTLTETAIFIAIIYRRVSRLPGEVFGSAMARAGGGVVSAVVPGYLYI